MSSVLGVLHGLDLLATGLLTGAIVYYRAIDRSADRRLPRRLAGLALLASLFWLCGAGGDMTGSWSPREMLAALEGTRFGVCGVLKLAVILALLGLIESAAAVWLALVLPVCSGLTGHAGAETARPALALGLDYAHFLAVGVWSGGLLALTASLRAKLSVAGSDLSGTLPTVRRFSRWAMGATAIIAATGVLAAARFGVSWRAPWATDYGRLVLLKTFLFCAALVAAGVNRFIHMRAWGAGLERRSAEGLVRAIRFELAAVALAFAAAGFLTGAELP